MGRLYASLSELGKIVDRAVPPRESWVRQGPLWALRFTEPTEPSLAVYGPMLCVVAQGEKQILLGNERLVYGSGRYLLNTVALPASGGVIEASPARPCLWIMIELDPSIIAEVALAFPKPDLPDSSHRAMDAPVLGADLLDSIIRLARLFETPEDAAFLGPLLQREIIYRLLRGGQAHRLRQAATQIRDSDGILGAIEWLRAHFRESMSIESLASECGLSPSSLHRRFKRVTAMTPLNFQRQMRLQEARRLMIVEGLDATSAGTRVGYDDPSYFSREYRRFFGDPPRRHTAQTRLEIIPPSPERILAPFYPSEPS